MIEQRYRDEFEQIGKRSLIRHIDAGNLQQDKQRQAYEWLDEQENGPERAYKAKAWRLQIFIAVVSLAGLIVSIIAVMKK